MPIEYLPNFAETLSQIKPFVEQVFAKKAADISAQKLGEIYHSIQKSFIAKKNNDLFLSSMWEKVSRVKTIDLNDAPVLLKDIYVPMKFNSQNRLFTDLDLLDVIKSVNRIIVQGSAGLGKTFFMKYAVIKSIEDKSEKIPLFIEARRFNFTSNTTLFKYMFAEFKGPIKDFSEDDFSLLLEKGMVSLFIDGFDELSFEKRPIVEAEIERLSNTYKNTAIIISSRPDDSFIGWSNFSVFDAQYFEIDQIRKLIETLPFQQSFKDRFIAFVESQKFAKYKNLLGTPLLTSAMMHTYKKIGQIPSDLHDYYEYSFETLYHFHDASKSQYSRSSRTKMNASQFKKCFSAFCAASYKFEQISIPIRDAEEYASVALRHVGSNDGPIDFINDLISNVCMLQRDGNYYTYSHRSFQEYFTAKFFLSLPDHEMKIAFENSCLRVHDDTIRLCYAIDKSAVQRNFILPAIKDIILEFKSKQKIDDFFGLFLEYDFLFFLIDRGFKGRTVQLKPYVSFHRQVNGQKNLISAKIFLVESFLNDGIPTFARFFKSFEQADLVFIHSELRNARKGFRNRVFHVAFSEKIKQIQSIANLFFKKEKEFSDSIVDFLNFFSQKKKEIEKELKETRHLSRNSFF